jgi:phosphatidylglycerol lysyltransferase
MPADPTSERARVHALLKLHGWNASSFQTLAPDFSYWFDGADACVSYVDTGRAWVAAGAPIARPDRIAAVASRFVEAARAERRRASFFGTEERFTAAVPFGALSIGEQPVWNPQHWEATLRSSANLREQLRRARAKGILVRELLAADLAADASFTRLQLEALVRRWLAARPLPPMRFLVQLDPFTFLTDKRCWVAERAGQPVGLLVAVPIYQRQGWLFENLLRDARTPNGTIELLVASAMRAVREQGCRYVTLGLVPLSGGVGSVLRAARYLGRGLYDFEGLRRFKTKLRPNAWSPIFLSVPASQPKALALLDVLEAFAGGSLGAFGLRALRSRPVLP